MTLYLVKLKENVYYTAAQCSDSSLCKQSQPGPLKVRMPMRQ